MSKHDKHNKKVGAEHSAPTEVPVEAELVEEVDQLEALQAEVLHWKEHAARVQAEFENARKRLEERHAQSVLLAGEKIVTRIIPVLDDLDYAIMHSADDDSHRAGYEAIRTKLLDGLVSQGVEEINPLGEDFDPNSAQAVQMVESAEVPEGHVVSVLQKGYRLGNRVLRVAMVTVSNGPKK